MSNGRFHQPLQCVQPCPNMGHKPSCCVWHSFVPWPYTPPWTPPPETVEEILGIHAEVVQ